MPDPNNKLVNFKDKFPKEDNSTVEIISKNEDGLIEMKKRRLHTSKDFFTITNLEKSIQNLDDKIASLEGNRYYYLEILEWAKANGIAKTEDEFRANKLKNDEIKQIKELEEMKDKTPEDMVLLTTLKKKHKND